MAMTRAQLRTEVYNRLAEAAGFHSDAEINQWLDDGIQDICLSIEPLIKPVTSNIVAGTGEVTLPTDTISLKYVVHKTSATGAWNNLQETTYEELFRANPGWEDDQGTPSHYYWRVGAIGLYPVPKTNVTGGLRIYYTYIAAALSGDSATSPLDPWLDKAIVLYAIFRCRMKDRDEQRASATAMEYRGLIEEARQKIDKHRKEHGPRLVPVMRNYRQYYQRRWARPTIRVSSS